MNYKLINCTLYTIQAICQRILEYKNCQIFVFKKNLSLKIFQQKCQFFAPNGIAIVSAFYDAHFDF